MTARGEVAVTHEGGLHARPAVALTGLAKRFACRIRVRALPDEAWVDAKSIVKVMGMRCKRGTVLEIEAEGADEDGAVVALRELIERDFESAGAP